MNRLATMFTLMFLIAVTFTWDMPTTNEDGSPLTDLAGARVHYGTAPGVYDTTIDAGNVSTYTVNMPEGNYYGAISAYDTSGNEGAKSNEVNFTYRLGPDAPVNLRVTF